MNIRFLTLLLISAVVFSASAHADCADPVGVAGELRWMPDAGTLKWCDGAGWNRLADSRGDSATYYGTGAGLSLGHFLYRGSDWAGFALWDRDGTQATNNDHDAVIFWGDDADDSLRFAWTGNSGPLTERMRLTAAGSLGIGTTSPASRLDVNGSIRSSGNSIIAGGTVEGGQLLLGYKDNSTVTGEGAATWNIDSDANNNFRVFRRNASNVVLNILTIAETSGNVGIGALTPAYALDVNGSIRAANVIYTSDARLKADVRPVSGLDTILRLRGVSYDFKADGRHATGVIAQEIEPVMPHAVLTAPDGIKSVDYIQIIAPLIEAVKELKADNDNLRAEIDAIKAARTMKPVKERGSAATMRLNN